MNEARDWYDSQSPGIGDQFIDALEKLIQRIATNPGQFPRVKGRQRRALLHRYPYALFFFEAADGVHVFACAHTRRAPARWKRRL